MFNKIFPIRIYLFILQLEGYDLKRFWRWWFAHPATRKLPGKKVLVWTNKAKILAVISLFWLILLGVWRWYLLPLGIIFPGIILTLAAITVWPVDYLSRKFVAERTRKLIEAYKKGGMKVVVVSGSFGKTSVKEYLYQFLKTKYKVLRTPENFNTLLGIAKVVDLELTDQYEFFIVELGAYKIGETNYLCEIVQPDVAILTGLNMQHLERFGGLEAEIEGESESIKYVLENGGKAFANYGSKLVKERWNDEPKITAYGEGEYESVKEQNIAGAWCIAKTLGIVKTPELWHPKHRLTEIVRGEMVIVDDAYSSNPDGFLAAINYLQKFNKWKVVVTPGIIELGKETKNVHQEIGQIMKGRIDQLILVGKNERTQNLERGFGGGEYVERVEEAVKLVRETNAVVLYENDLPDQYY